MSDLPTQNESPAIRYLKLRLQLPSVADPMQLEELNAQIADMRSKSYVVSMLAAVADIQTRHPAVFPLIAVSLALNFFF
jgi:hypothetical protein